MSLQVLCNPRTVRKAVNITLEPEVLAAVDARNENRSEEINSVLRWYYKMPKL